MLESEAIPLSESTVPAIQCRYCLLTVCGIEAYGLSVKGDEPSGKAKSPCNEFIVVDKINTKVISKLY